MKHLSVKLLVIAALSVFGVSTPDALVLCVNPSGSVIAVDTCKPGWTQLAPAAAGLQGPPGPQGPAGPAGPTGPQGPAGTSGSNEVFIAKTDLFSDNTSDGRPVSVSLPAGTYLVTGKTYITSDVYGGCNIKVGGTFYNHAFFESGVVEFAAVMIDQVTLAEAGDVNISCGTGFGVTWFAASSVLTAQPIAP